MSPTAKHIDKIVDEPVAMQYQMPTIQTARQLKMDAMRFDEYKTFATTEEDLEGDARTGACVSESTENSRRPTGPAH